LGLTSTIAGLQIYFFNTLLYWVWLQLLLVCTEQRIVTPTSSIHHIRFPTCHHNTIRGDSIFSSEW